MGYVFDGTNKIISLTSGTTTLDVRDLYSAWKAWSLNGGSNFLQAFSVVGGDPVDIAQGIYVTSYFFLENSWKIRPQEASHKLKVSNGVLVTADGSDPFVPTLGTFNILIQYSQPVKSETVATGGGGGPTSEQIADAVWDEALVDHATTGSAGKTLAGAGSAGDPWEIVLPGMYGNNTAGKIIGTNLNAKVGDVKDKTDLIPTDPATNTQVNTRMESFTYVAPDNASITSIKNKTDALPTDPASNTQVNTRMGTFTYVAPDNTGISNIKTQTDKLHFSGDNVQAKVSDKGVLNDPSVTDIDTQLSLVHGAGGWGGDNGLTIEDIVAGVVDGLEPLQVDVTTIKNSVSVIEQIEKGKWEIANGVMTLYGSNGTTVLARFKLYDASNKLATTVTQIPVKRVPY